VDSVPLDRLRDARAQAQELAWAQAMKTRGSLPQAAAAGQPIPALALDLDASIVLCHSEKESATPTWKKTFGYNPCSVFWTTSARRCRGCGGKAGAGRTRPPITSPNDGPGQHLVTAFTRLAELPRPIT